MRQQASRITWRLEGRWFWYLPKRMPGVSTPVFFRLNCTRFRFVDQVPAADRGSRSCLPPAMPEDDVDPSRIVSSETRRTIQVQPCQCTFKAAQTRIRIFKRSLDILGRRCTLALKDCFGFVRPTFLSLESFDSDRSPTVRQKGVRMTSVDRSSPVVTITSTGTSSPTVGSSTVPRSLRTADTKKSPVRLVRSVPSRFRTSTPAVRNSASASVPVPVAPSVPFRFAASLVWLLVSQSVPIPLSAPATVPAGIPSSSRSNSISARGMTARKPDDENTVPTGRRRRVTWYAPSPKRVWMTAHWRPRYVTITSAFCRASNIGSTSCDQRQRWMSEVKNACMLRKRREEEINGDLSDVDAANEYCVWWRASRLIPLLRKCRAQRRRRRRVLLKEAHKLGINCFLRPYAFEFRR